MQKVVINDGKHTIGKSQAEAILLGTNNSLNRKAIPAKVKAYVKDMMSNQWGYVADPIRISDTGNLLDGQHRLLAIIESDTTQDLYFILNLPEVGANGHAMFEYMDKITRKPHEVLQIANPELLHAKEIVELMNQLDMFNQQMLEQRPNGVKKSTINILEFSNDFKPLNTLDSYVVRGKVLSSRTHIDNKTLPAKSWNLFEATIGQLDKGKEFLQELADYQYEDGVVYDIQGQSVEFTDPIANLLFNLNREKGGSKNAPVISSAVRLRLVFNAFNSYALGNDVKPKDLGAKMLFYPISYDGYYELAED